LKPGDYKVEVRDSKAVIRGGKLPVETPIKIESSDGKFNSTSVRYQSGSGPSH